MKAGPWTVTLDLTKSFNTCHPGFLHLAKKRPGIPVLNHFSIWKDVKENAIYIQGGHFYNGDIWNRSSYFVNKSDIPQYNTWKLDIHGGGWHDITREGNSKANFNRTFGGAFLSAPDLSLSPYICWNFWLMLG
jgi:hypothetical protein